MNISAKQLLSMYRHDPTARAAVAAQIDAGEGRPVRARRRADAAPIRQGSTPWPGSVSHDTDVPSLANIRHAHWSQAARVVSRQKAVVWTLLAPYALPALPVVVTLTRRGKKVLDSDNCQRALKAHRDAVAKMLGCDDADPRINWRYEQGLGVEGFEIQIAPTTKGG